MTRDPVVGPDGLKRTCENPERPPYRAPYQNFQLEIGPLDGPPVTLELLQLVGNRWYQGPPPNPTRRTSTARRVAYLQLEILIGSLVRRTFRILRGKRPFLTSVSNGSRIRKIRRPNLQKAGSVSPGSVRVHSDKAPCLWNTDIVLPQTEIIRNQKLKY